MDPFHSLLFLPISHITGLNKVKANGGYKNKHFLNHIKNKNKNKQWASVLFTTAQKLVSFQLPGFIGFITPQVWIEMIGAFSASSSGLNSTYLASLGDSTSIVTTGLKSGQLRNPRRCPAEQSQSQTQRLCCRLLLAPAKASGPKLFTLQALLSWASALLSSWLRSSRGEVNAFDDSCWLCLSV